ncbi:efflux RND transporter periplasmic adaptor subunit [Aquisalimonas sp.]|uniref:efflux RND transporter periplasmic adaptor subunit n=1 Tax=Aquisalimonas sp. TaxID=1872621 RepID=UPI0025C0DAD9|nr:efflux RND transporter periplasmic adaptor subunit [Aquisalimonas sp.]
MARKLTLSVLLGLAVVAVGCDNNDNGGEDEAPPEAVLITKEEATLRTVEVAERTLGRLTSKTAPSLTAEVSGQITAIHVEEGDSVSRGDLLLEIDPEPYELALAQARTDMRRLEVSLRTQRRELERSTELLEDGYVTQSEYEATEGEVESLEEDLEGARARVRNAERDLRKTRVETPVDGAIDERAVSEGDYTSPGEPMFTVVSQDLLRVRLPFPETVAQHLEVGQPVTLSAPVAGGTVEATISELRPGLADQSLTFEAIANVENPGGWRQGGSVSASVLIEERESVVVPAEALVQRPAGEVVFVIDNDTAHQREVEVGQRGANSIEIRSGLDAGESIAVDGAGFLSDQAAVRTGEE